MIAAALSVFLVAYILDTGAVVRLLWAALTGQFGTGSRVAASGIVLLLGYVIALMLYRPARPPPAKVRKKATRPATRTDAHNERNGTKDGSPADIAPIAKRPRKKTTGVVADRPV